MILDARNPDTRLDIDADIVIVGAGVAGITIALELARSHRIAVIESGGSEPASDTQALYDGEISGLNYSLLGSRLRYLGGTSNHWGGWCGLLDSIDFEQRAWVNDSGWPFGREALTPFFDQAADILNLGAPRFEVNELVASDQAVHRLSDERMTHRVMRFSNPITRMGEKYRQQLTEQANLQLLLNANVTDIQLAESGDRVEQLSLQTLSGRAGRVRARQCVVACGGIENARLLLCCNKQMPSGLGNQNGLVGRFFMEHPHVTPVDILPHDPDWCRGQMALRQDGDYWFGLAMRPTRSAMAERGILNFNGHFFNVPCDDGSMRGIGVMVEQAPNPDSRVTLSDQQDALGMPRTRLHWSLTDQDWTTIQTLPRLLAETLGVKGLGRVRVRDWVLERDDGGIGFGSHHMGTTRMANDPRRGVVDSDCRVHGIENLHIAGSSVFPTGGAINPTLTLTTLSLRLARHLKPLLA